MKNLTALLLLMAITVHSSLAQNSSTMVHGVVRDSVGIPIANLTVFIPFTSTGSTTNHNGEYILNNIPTGKVELEFRHVSYLPQAKTIMVKSREEFELNVVMLNNVIDLNEIVKRADPDNWRFGYEKFIEHVLGDPNEMYCEVKNPEALYFYYDGEQLSGHAIEPLEIVNNYLGYKQILFLDYFWYKIGKTKPDGSPEQVKYAFSGATFYVDRINDFWLRKMVWQRNREKEFKGTLRHFLQSLYSDQLNEEGYVIRKSWAGVEALKQSEKISTIVAYAKSLEMGKIYYWDPTTKESLYLVYRKDQDYPIHSTIDSLNQEPNSKCISLEDQVLVFNYRNSDRVMDDAKIAYMEIVNDESTTKTALIFDSLGSYFLKGAELIWSYLDNQTSLVTAIPADYNGGKK